MRRFWRGIAIFLLGGVLGTAFGIALGFFFPYVFPPPPAFEQLTQADVAPRSGAAPSTAVVDKPPAPVASGTFIHANPSDPVHYGMGRTSVFEDVVRLESDFVVGPGPKYKVLLHTARGIRRTEDIHAARFVDLGPLRAFQGSQNYAIPAGIKAAVAVVMGIPVS